MSRRRADQLPVAGPALILAGYALTVWRPVTRAIGRRLQLQLRRVDDRITNLGD